MSELTLISELHRRSITEDQILKMKQDRTAKVEGHIGGDKTILDEARFSLSPKIDGEGSLVISIDDDRYVQEQKIKGHWFEPKNLIPIPPELMDRRRNNNLFGKIQYHGSEFLGITIEDWDRDGVNDIVIFVSCISGGPRPKGTYALSALVYSGHQIKKIVEERR